MSSLISITLSIAALAEDNYSNIFKVKFLLDDVEFYDTNIVPYRAYCSERHMGNGVDLQRFVAKIDNMANVDGEYLLTTDSNGKFGFFLADPKIGYTYTFIGKRWSTTPLPDKWYLLVGTYDGSGSHDGINLYVDGVSCGDVTDNRKYDAMDNTPKPLCFGKYGSHYLDGMMDEVAIFNVELTSDEVSDLHCRGLNGLGFCDTLIYILEGLNPWIRLLLKQLSLIHPELGYLVMMLLLILMDQ